MLRLFPATPEAQNAEILLLVEAPRGCFFKSTKRKMANAKILVLVEVPRGYVFFKSTKRKATEDGIHREEGGPSNLLPWIPASVVMFLIFRFLDFRLYPKIEGKSMENAPPQNRPNSKLRK